jgi:seryl-tRNA synthetase
MVLVQLLREQKQKVLEAYRKRNIDAENIVEQILEADDYRKSNQAKLDSLLNQSKTIAKSVGELFSQGKREEANKLKEKSTALKQEIKYLQDRAGSISTELADLLYQLPNVPHVLVPDGKTDQDNEEVFRFGDIPEMGKNALPHWELAKKYNLIDFETGVKITGAGFPVYTGNGARLQRALIQFFLDEAVKAGYLEVQTPFMVNEASGIGTGQLPDKEGQMYQVPIDGFYLIPTAEVPVTNIFRDTMLSIKDLPVKRTAYSPCFRREAGSYGKDVRGLNRLHQFDKVEIVQITEPGLSYQTLDEMLEHVKSILTKLELPYRIVRLCGGDLGFAAALTYDFEVYSAAQDKWLEVSSVSNFESYQSNRLKCRYKNSDGKTELVHTLNGSALALPRILASLLENNQNENGISIPEVLIPYTGFHEIN